jgi:hypothetical protein
MAPATSPRIPPQIPSLRRKIQITDRFGLQKIEHATKVKTALAVMGQGSAEETLSIYGSGA